MEITDTQIISTLREVVAERPDYVYKAPAHMEGAISGACFYVHTDGGAGKPGCIVGYVLNRLGVPLADLTVWEGTSALEVAAEFGVSDEAARTLNHAQIVQDGGESWSAALESAERYFAEVAGE